MWELLDCDSAILTGQGNDISVLSLNKCALIVWDEISSQNIKHTFHMCFISSNLEGGKLR